MNKKAKIVFVKIALFGLPILFLGSCSNKKGNNIDITKSEDVYVAFDTNGGTVIKNFEVDDYYKIEKPLNPTKEGSIFIGWYEDKSYERKFNFNDQILKDKVLYAGWVEEKDLADFTYTINNDNLINTNNVDNTITINGVKNENKTIYDIPSGVTKLSANIFTNNSLSTIILPNTLKNIESQAFCECYSLGNVYYKGTINDWLNITFGDYESNPMYYASNFYELNNKGKIKYQNHNYDLLEKLDIPDGTSKIGSYQFCGFNFEEILIPKSVTSIGLGAFSNCSLLRKITLPFVGNRRYESSENTAKYPFGYIFGKKEYSGGVSTQQVYMSGNNYGSNTATDNYFIPSSLKEVYLTNTSYLQYGAFYGCSNIININLNDEITNIDTASFKNCSSLKNIVIPKSVLSIGGSLLSGCSSLESITIPFVGNKRYESSDVVPQYPLGYIFGSVYYDGSEEISQKSYAYNSRYSRNEYSNVTYYFPLSLKSVIITDMTYEPTYAFLNCGKYTIITK